MSIGRIAPSVVSGTNENTFALVNFNVDFSLLKLDAPREFTGLGLSLTRKRREMAEEGAVHRTARRLGALFESIAPHAPSVIRAYGLRASEICESSPKEQLGQRQGIFADCAGADGTSVWAAATSGKSAIAVHLLACMLARAWSSSQATSIWVEIVQERRRLLQKQVQDGLYDSTIQFTLAVTGEITREDVAHWDASARAWLQISDDAQLRRQKQLMLIVNNLNLPVNQGTTDLTTYSRVVEAWTTALRALEKLVNGESQSVSKGSVLLGLASWHLYPNLLVLGTTSSPVDFEDPIIEDCGRLTIGLENPDTNSDEGVYWSLSLAHLKYYGDPVKVTSFTTRDASRLQLDEFSLLVLGSILADWGSHMTVEVNPAAEFFIALEECLRGAAQCPKGKDDYLYWEHNWIRLIANASRNFLSLKDTQRAQASSIIALGHRRGRALLGNSPARPPPMLGLCFPWIQHVLQSSDMAKSLEQVEMMRFVAHTLEIPHNQCLIGLVNNGVRSYVTALPHDEFDSFGTLSSSYHINWTERSQPRDIPGLDEASRQRFCNCHWIGHSCHKGMCPCIAGSVVCSDACHSESVNRDIGCPKCEPGHTPLPGPVAEPLRYEYGCPNLIDGRRFRYVASPMFNGVASKYSPRMKDWGIPPISSLAYSSTGSSRKHPSPPLVIRLAPAIYPEKAPSLCPCYHRSASGYLNKVTFVLVAGNLTDVGLYLRTDYSLRAERERVKKAVARAKGNATIPVQEVTDALRSGRMHAPSVANYLRQVYTSTRISVPVFHKDLHIKVFDVSVFLRSLHTFSLAARVYQGLPGSTISLQLISTPLSTASWTTDLETRSLTRQETFACIAMLESGAYNIDPRDLNDVIAISSRNSIFVSQLLLQDPFTLDHVDGVSRVVGNVGRTGMILMVAPHVPRIRNSDLNDFRLVTHAPFDGKKEDSFNSTTGHLRFTEFEMAFNVGDRGAIDKDLCLVETLVQVFERDKWVGDIDVLPLFRDGNDLVRRNPVRCSGCSNNRKIPRYMVTMDNWEEILDVPEGLGRQSVAVFRAHDNWFARLAAASMCLQKGFRIVINPTNDVCWHCSCRKRWGWNHSTILESCRASRPGEGLYDAAGRDDNDSGEESDNAIVSEGNLSDHEVEPDSDSSSDSDPDSDPEAEDMSTSRNFFDNYRGITDLRSPTHSESGYESHETQIPIVNSDEDNEEQSAVLNLPQVFIM